jgi:hypothetical protein
LNLQHNLSTPSASSLLQRIVTPAAAPEVAKR